MGYVEEIIQGNAPTTILENPASLKNWVHQNVVGKSLNQLKTDVGSDSFYGMDSTNYYHYASDYIQNKREEEGRNLTMGEQIAITDMMRQIGGAPTVFYSQDADGRAVPRNFRSEIAAQHNQSNWWRNMSSNALYSMASLPSRAVGLINPELGLEYEQYYQQSYAPQDAPGATAGKVIGAGFQAVPLLAGGIPSLITMAAYGASGAGEARSTALDQRRLGYDISGWDEATAAVAKGSIEVGSALLTRGLAKVAGNAAKPILSRFAPKLMQTLITKGVKPTAMEFAKAVGKFTGATLGEGFEEATAEVLSNYVDTMVLDVKKDIGEGAGEAFKIGALTNVALGLLSAGRLAGANMQVDSNNSVNAYNPLLPQTQDISTSPAVITQVSTDMLTPTTTQIEAIHRLKNELKLSNEELSGLLEKTTGQRNLSEVTEVGAIDVINALDNAAHMNFNEPLIGDIITAQAYHAERMGLGPLVQESKEGKIRLQKDFEVVRNEIDHVSNKLNEMNRISKRQTRKLRRRGLPTEPESRMAKLLDTHETAPDFLPPGEKAVFNRMRKLTRNIIQKKNEVNKQMGKPLIPYRSNYIPHIAKEIAEDFYNGEAAAIPPEVLYWMRENVNKDVVDKRDLERTLAEKIGERFSTDLRSLMKGMAWSGLRTAHLSQPLKHFKDQMDLVKHVIPASTRRWVTDYVNTAIKGQQTELDEHVNNWMKTGGIGKLIDKGLKPFGRELSKRPVTDLFQQIGALNIYGTMAFRPKLLVRNMFQRIQNIALYGFEASYKANIPSNDPVLNELLDQSTFLQSYTGAEELSPTGRGILKRYGMGPYQWTATNNAKTAMKAAFFSTEPWITDPKHKDLGWADPQRTYTEPKGFMYESEKQALLKEMEFGAGATQYQYIGLAMPKIFRHKTLIPATRLMSWWMNYFMQFNREALHRMFTGETGYGKKIPSSHRLNWGKYIMTGGPILQSLGYGASFMTGALPTRLSPTAGLMWGVYAYATADDERERKQAEYQIKGILPTFVPGGLSIKDAEALYSGKKDLKEIMFYKQRGLNIEDVIDVAEGRKNVGDVVWKKRQ